MDIVETMRRNNQMRIVARNLRDNLFPNKNWISRVNNQCRNNAMHIIYKQGKAQGTYRNIKTDSLELMNYRRNAIVHLQEARFVSVFYFLN